MGDRYRYRYRTNVSSPSLWFFNRVYDRTPAVEGLTGDGDGDGDYVRIVKDLTYGYGGYYCLY